MSIKSKKVLLLLFFSAFRSEVFDTRIVQVEEWVEKEFTGDT